MIAFAVKVPLFPLHTWLPDAHTQAPTGGSVILAGVLLKMGTYGMLRFGVYLFPQAAIWAKPVLLTLAVIGILYGAIAATMQKDLKRLVAYSSVAHLGFIVLGTFAMTTQAITGGVMQMVNHGVSTGADCRAWWHSGCCANFRGLFYDRDVVINRSAGSQRLCWRIPCTHWFI
jgi:NADH-quinone oxidoreductase subunit M